MLKNKKHSIMLMYSSNPYPSNPSNRNPWRILAIVFIILFALALALQTKKPCKGKVEKF